MGRTLLLSLSLLGSSILIGCGAPPDSSHASDDSSSDGAPSDSTHATERTLMGAHATPPDRTATPTTDAEIHDVLVDILIERLEKDDPTSLALWDKEMASGDPNMAVRGIVSFYKAVNKAGGSSEIQKAIAADSSLHLSNTGSQDGEQGDDADKQPDAKADSTTPQSRKDELAAIDKGGKAPDPSSRLGAYEATKDYKEGTVGAALHGVIGGFYRGLGSVGQEKFGDFVRQPDVQNLLSQPLSNADASRQFADKEYAYWKSQPNSSVGGWMGSAVPPSVRDYGLRWMYGK